AAGTLYAVLLAFLVVLVWEAYTSAKTNIAEEASTLTTMYRQTNGMPADEQRQMRGYLREYTEAVVNDEWNEQVNGGSSARARKAIGDIYRAFGAMDPAVAGTPL